MARAVRRKIQPKLRQHFKAWIYAILNKIGQCFYEDMARVHFLKGFTKKSGIGEFMSQEIIYLFPKVNGQRMVLILNDMCSSPMLYANHVMLVQAHFFVFCIL